MVKKARQYNRRAMEAGLLRDDQADYLLELGTRAFQKNQGLVEDGMAGPKTRGALDQIIVPLQEATRQGLGYVPSGKGIYIRRLSRAAPPYKMVEMCKQNDISFVCVLSTWQERRWHGKVTSRKANSVEDLTEYGEVLKKAGIEVWVWGYPHPSMVPEFVESCAEDAGLINAVGIILDPEKPFKGKHQEADVLVNLMIDACREHDLAAGFTSYAATWWHKTLPYSIFAELPGFGSPQVYDNQNSMGASYAAKAVATYHELGWQDIVISAPAYNKTPDQLRHLLNTYPRVPALIFWDWDNLNLKKYQNLWTVIRDTKLL